MHLSRDCGAGDPFFLSAGRYYGFGCEAADGEEVLNQIDNCVFASMFVPQFIGLDMGGDPGQVATALGIGDCR